MKVNELPVSSELKQAILDDGITELYPPQAETINKGLTSGSNFVIAIPTASGKTLIAIIAMFNAILQNPGMKAIYLAPLRALAAEKYNEFKSYGEKLGLRVSISTGDLDGKSNWLGKSDIIIATNEKFDSLIRHEASWLNEIGIVVTDEVHLINDGHRGPVLEIVLTLLKRNLPECQIIALSATINNAIEISEWLNAQLVFSTWRPVELREGVWASGKTHFSDGSIVESGLKSDRTGYVSLALETVKEDGQSIIFANTRKSAEATAETVSKKLSKKLNDQNLGELKVVAANIRSSGEKTEMREKLANLIEKGVAFHHAGLASVHRKIVEDSFRGKIVKIVASSPSLAAGVNMPSRRVIIRSLLRYSFGYGNAPIPVLEYKQMAGRAGRPRFDPYGEAIILAKSEDEIPYLLDQYVRSETEEIYSKLGTEPALRSHLLAFIAANYVDNFAMAIEMISKTFFGYQNEDTLYLVEGEVSKGLELLTEAKLISPKEPYIVTPFGKRTTELYLDPLSARLIKTGLEQFPRREDLPDIVYLQLIASTPDIRTYTVRQKEIAKIIDLAEEYSEDWMDSDFGDNFELSHELFFSTLKIAKVIDLWLNEASEEDIFIDFGISSGDLHHILNTAEWLLHSANEFSRIFKWKNHRKKIGLIIKRLKYGVSDQLLKLVDIPGIGRVRARSLYDSGFTTIDKIQKAPIDVLSKLPNFGPLLAKNLKKALDGEINENEINDLMNQATEETEYQTTLSSFFD